MHRERLLLIALAMSGCLNPYTRFYRGQPDARGLAGYDSTTQQEPAIYNSTGDIDRDVDHMIRIGYLPFGQSIFNAASNGASEWELRNQARAIGAHAVVVLSRYTNTVSGAIPLSVPTTTTTYSSGSATAYGPGGSVTAYGNGTSTTYGSETVMMPYSVARSDFTAIYFFRSKRPRLGIFPWEAGDDVHRKLGTNAGILVRVVTEGTPAFRADVLAGDVLLKIGDDNVYSVREFYDLLGKYEGHQVVLVLDRDGQRVEKTVEVLSHLR